MKGLKCTFHILAFLSSERSTNLDNTTHLIGAACCLFSSKYNYITQIAKSLYVWQAIHERQYHPCKIIDFTDHDNTEKDKQIHTKICV